MASRFALNPGVRQHDPLDGLITYHQLRKYSEEDSTDLEGEIAEMTEICQDRSWATDGSLGIGCLLCDAYRAAQLIASGYFQRTDLLESVLSSALSGLKMFEQNNTLQYPADYRLAFRELGLSIGMRAVARLGVLIEENPSVFDDRLPLKGLADMLTHFMPLIEEIESFWVEPSNRESRTWKDHLDINMVMLATSLAPDGFLTL